MQNRVKEFRELLGISQEQLSSMSGVGRSTISEIEADKHVPNIEAAIRIARAMETTVEMLFPVSTD